MSEASVEQPAAESQKPQETAPAQEETDWKAEARKWEARAKENREKAEQFDAFTESQKTEQQKLADRLAAAEQAAAERESLLLRYQVAADKGIPLAAAARLQGSSKEELEADAEQFLQLIGERDKPRTPRPDPTQGRGNNPSLSTAEQFAAALGGSL